MATPSKILPPHPSGIARCVDLILAGELVALPTETVYGLAGNALREDSIRKIFTVKGRPLIDPLITHVTDIEAAGAYADLNESAVAVATHFWPGPVTMVLPKKAVIPDLATAGLPSVAIRSPRHELFRRVLEGAGVPLVAPSANPFGYISPTKAEHVFRTLGPGIAAILDGGPCACGIESTIIDLRLPDDPKLLRPGPIPVEALSEVLGQTVALSRNSMDDKAQVSPGNLSKHYSPSTDLELIDAESAIRLARESATGVPEALVLMKRPPGIQTADDVYWLSEAGTADEAAANLYDLLQRLDRMNYEKIRVETPPNTGLWGSLLDRLKRASART